MTRYNNRNSNAWYTPTNMVAAAVTAETVTTILERSDNSIIIIQSDTGPDITFSNLTDAQHKLGRMSILTRITFQNKNMIYSMTK